MHSDLNPTARFDADVLRAGVARLTDYFVDQGRLPHIRLAVYDDGVCVLDMGAGTARADGTPLQRDALYRIASMTKPVTSVAFLMLVERGLVSLDSPVSDVLPELKDQRVFCGMEGNGQWRLRPVARPMTMRDLLTHQSGLSCTLQDQSPVDALYGAQKLDSFHPRRSADETLAALAEVPLVFSPGDGWHYSMATDVLGIAIEQMVGCDLETWLRDALFTPLGMIDSHFVVPAHKLDRLTDAWMLDDHGQLALFDRGEASRWRQTPRMAAGSAGLVSSVDDYARFAHMLLNGGVLDGNRVLRSDTVALMRANHLLAADDLGTLSTGMFSGEKYRGIGFGLGLGVTLPGRANDDFGSAGSVHWAGLLSTGFLVDPARKIVAIAMAQVMPWSAYYFDNACWELIYAARRDRSRG